MTYHSKYICGKGKGMFLLIHLGILILILEDGFKICQAPYYNSSGVGIISILSEKVSIVEETEFNEFILNSSESEELKNSYYVGSEDVLFEYFKSKYSIPDIIHPEITHL